jgi:hypothetical protein
LLALSGAILHGWRHTDATILGVMDADGQHPAEILPELVAAIVSGRDLAIASRYATGGRGGWNPLRRLISMAAILAAGSLQPAGPRVQDPLSGFFLVQRHSVEHTFFQTAGFKLLLEILVRGRIGSVKEIPFAFGRRRAGRSKVNARVAWEYAVLLGRLYAEKYGSVRAQEPSGGLRKWGQHILSSKRGQYQPQQKKPQHAEEKYQCHADAGLAVHFRHQVAGSDIERDARR